MDEAEFKQSFLLIFGNEFDRAICLLKKGLAALESEDGDAASEGPRRPTRADILFGICCCYRAMFDKRQTKFYLHQLVEITAGDEGFRFSAILRVMKQNFEDKSARLLHLLPSVDKFIADAHYAGGAKRWESPFLPIGLVTRATILFVEWRIKHAADEQDDSTRACLALDREIAVAESLCPGFSILLELKMSIAQHRSVNEWLRYCSTIIEIIPPNPSLLRALAIVCYRRGNYRQSLETFTNYFKIKPSKRSEDYDVIFSMMAARGGPFDIIGSILLPYIDKSPERILEAMKGVKAVPFVDLVALNYSALCLFKLERFSEALEAFSSVKQVARALNSYAEAWGEEAPAKFRAIRRIVEQSYEKIPECNIQIARRRRASFVIYRALLDAYHRPGGPGYFKAFEHFNSLAGAR